MTLALFLVPSVADPRAASLFRAADDEAMPSKCVFELCKWSWAASTSSSRGDSSYHHKRNRWARLATTSATFHCLLLATTKLCMHLGTMSSRFNDATSMDCAGDIIIIISPLYSYRHSSTPQRYMWSWMLSIFSTEPKTQRKQMIWQWSPLITMFYQAAELGSINILARSFLWVPNQRLYIISMIYLKGRLHDGHHEAKDGHTHGHRWSDLFDDPPGRFLNQWLILARIRQP